PDKPYELLMISFPFSITFYSSLTRPVTHLPADNDECGGFYMNLVVKGGSAGGTFYAVRKEGGLLTEQETFITYGLPEL
ncbi:MAG: hypothetical protein Q4Q03_03695, partial [Bowdeniella nasicola]|nr:hypothetical protein [Bowdeniella nasicola]